MIYQSGKWSEFEESALNDELMITEFSKDTRQTLYVCCQGVLKGIVTLGNFRRHFFKGEPLIQEKFTYVSLKNEPLAIKILKENEKIFSIPILDSKGHIIKEYRKSFEDTEINKIPNDLIFKLYKQFILPDNETKTLIITEFNNSQKDIAERIMAETCGRLFIIDEREIADLNIFLKQTDCQIIYDCHPESYRVRQIAYKKYGFTYSLLKRPEPDAQSRTVLHDFLMHFKSIAVLSQEIEYFKSVADPSVKVYSLDEKRFRWNEEKNCFEYKLEESMSIVPEALYVSYCLLQHPCIYYGNHIIPVISKAFPIYERRAWSKRFEPTVETRSSDYDFAYNIIPQLHNKGIKTFVITDIEQEWKKVSSFHVETARLLETKSRDERMEMIRDFFTRIGYGSGFFEEYKKIQSYTHNGYLQFADFAGRYINILRGERLTIGNPASAPHTLWLFGPCILQGIFTDDEHSPGSCLRKKIDASYYIKNMGNNIRNLHMSARDSTFKSGDIVVIYSYNSEIYRQAGLNTYSLLQAYQSCLNVMDHVMDSLRHIDGYLTEKISDTLYDILKKNHAFQTSLISSDRNTSDLTITFGIKKQNSMIPEQLSKWLSTVKTYTKEDSMRTGAVVMNCNPFTLGHRYLIEAACSQVDKLLVFVVEEDKSFFKFEDRIKMVRLGTEDLEKVTVIPSGKYIVSAETFPGYFEKDDNPDVMFDAAKDLDIFADIIAKELNIKVRFAGEEPSDKFTRQYNLAMSRILPEHGIDFVEIPRKRGENGEIVSASTVRKLMSEKKYSEIKDLVLPSIFEYLSIHY